MLLNRDLDGDESKVKLCVEVENPSAEAKPTPKVTEASTLDLMEQLTEALKRHLDRNRHRLIEESLAPAMDVHDESRPEQEIVRTSEDSHSDSVTKLLEDQPLGAASKQRAEWVERVLLELGQLKKRMRGYEGDYDAAKAEFPHFLTFAECDCDRQLKQKLVDIQGQSQFVTFAKEIVAQKSAKSLYTIEKDWKTHGPRKKNL